MPDKVMVTKAKLDSLAEAVGSKSGQGVPLTIEGMEDAVLGIETGIQPSGTLAISKNGTHDVTKYASARVNVKPKLQSKTVHPATVVQYADPDLGYDGLDEVVVEGMELEYISVTPSTYAQYIYPGVKPISLLENRDISVTDVAGFNLNSIVNEYLGGVFYTTPVVYFRGSITITAKFVVSDSVLSSGVTVTTIDGYSGRTDRGSWTIAQLKREHSGSDNGGMDVYLAMEGSDKGSTVATCYQHVTYNSYYRYDVSGYLDTYDATKYDGIKRVSVDPVVLSDASVTPSNETQLIVAPESCPGDPLYCDYEGSGDIKNSSTGRACQHSLECSEDIDNKPVYVEFESVVSMTGTQTGYNRVLDTTITYKYSGILTLRNNGGPVRPDFQKTVENRGDIDGNGKDFQQDGWYLIIENSHLKAIAYNESRGINYTSKTYTISVRINGIAYPMALSQVTVNPIPSEYIVPTGTKSITENGTGIDVSQYASVDVAVPTGEIPSNYGLITWDGSVLTVS